MEADFDPNLHYESSPIEKLHNISDIDTSHLPRIEDEIVERHESIAEFVETLRPRPITLTEDSKLQTTLNGKSSIFLFANSASGGNKAKHYLKLEEDKINFTIDKLEVELFIFNLLDAGSRSEGVRAVQIASEREKVRVVVAGGDGSMIWVLEELRKIGVPPTAFYITVMPFGTGNDLAAMLGWGRSPHKPVVGKNLKGLKHSVEQWMNAKPAKLDIWEVEIDVEENGYFGLVKKLDKGYTRVQMKDESGHLVTTYRRYMSNYFSMGLDARIGLSFDKKRSRSKAKNKFVYFWEGFKKIFCMSHPKVRDFTTSFITHEDGVSRSIFDQETRPVRKNAAVILALNTRTYGGGENYVWDKARSYSNVSEHQDYYKQQPGDNQLEWMLFPGIGLGLEQIKCFSGQARKIHQGKGPFSISMRSPKENQRVYMEIDGEYFYMMRPKEVRLRLAEISRDLEVLVHPNAVY